LSENSELQLFDAIVQCGRLQSQGCIILKDHLRQLATRRVVCRQKINKYLAAHPGTALKEVPFKKSNTVFHRTQYKVYLCRKAMYNTTARFYILPTTSDVDDFNLPDIVKLFMEKIDGFSGQNSG